MRFETLNSKDYTVAELRHIAGIMMINLPSKLTKAAIAQILAEAIESAHAEALTMTAPVEVSWPDFNKSTKTYNARMVSRLTGYATQNHVAHLIVDGATADVVDRLTAKQRRRFTKKANRQYGKLMAKLSK